MGAGSLYGFDVETELPLTRLSPEPGVRGVLRLLRSNRPLEVEGGPVVHSFRAPGVRFSMRRVGRRLVASCSVTGTFELDGREGWIRAHPAYGAGEMWEHRMIGTAFPLLLAERGDLVAHAAAIAVDGRALAIVGPTGRGKSTLAFAAPSLGHRVLAEDNVDVVFTDGRPLVWPGPRGVRLRPHAVADHRTVVGIQSALPGGGKAVHFLADDAHENEPLPLEAAVMLDENGPQADVEPLAAAAAVPALIPNLVFGGSDRLGEAFTLAARLADSVPFFRARLRDDLEAVPDALRTLLGRVCGARVA